MPGTVAVWLAFPILTFEENVPCRVCAQRAAEVVRLGHPRSWDRPAGSNIHRKILVADLCSTPVAEMCCNLLKTCSPEQTLHAELQRQT